MPDTHEEHVMTDTIDRATKVLRRHRVECTGPGEVTCAGCRDRGWMGWWDYYGHLAEALADADLVAMPEHDSAPTAKEETTSDHHA